jgi:hypothetical protein
MANAGISGSKSSTKSSSAASVDELGFEHEQFNDVVRVSIPCPRTKDWEFWCLLSSDRHWDNPHSDLKLQKKHLDQVYERRGCWIDAGDLFCVMQGKKDKRGHKSAVRPEHAVDAYYDKIVDDAVDWFGPYASRWVWSSSGNHEDAILNHNETDLHRRLVKNLNDHKDYQSNIIAANFANWTIFRFPYSSEGSSKVTLYTDHGWGGGGPVTQDTIQHNRRMTYVDADIIASGHTHGSWTMDHVRAHVTPQGKIQRRDQMHIKMPSYKDEYGKGEGGWALRKRGAGPRPIGAWWLRFTYDNHYDRVVFDTLRAR